MQTIPALHLPSEHRVKRLNTWLILWLVRFAAHVLWWLPREAARAWVWKRRRHVTILLVLTAMHRLTPPRISPLRYCYDPNWKLRRFNVRRIGGMALKRALRGRTMIDTCRALYAALTDGEKWIARIAQRLMRRFTKLRCRVFAAFVAPPLCAVHLRIAGADSS